MAAESEFRQSPTKDEHPSAAMAGIPLSEKNTTVNATDDVMSSANDQDEPAVERSEKDLMPTEDAQRGVQQVEAVALTWTKPHLIAVFCLYVDLLLLSLVEMATDLN
jgi:hypothetical protein